MGGLRRQHLARRPLRAVQRCALSWSCDQRPPRGPPEASLDLQRAKVHPGQHRAHHRLNSPPQQHGAEATRSSSRRLCRSASNIARPTVIGAERVGSGPPSSRMAQPVRSISAQHAQSRSSARPLADADAHQREGLPHRSPNRARHAVSPPSEPDCADHPAPRRLPGAPVSPLSSQPQLDQVF